MELFRNSFQHFKDQYEECGLCQLVDEATRATSNNPLNSKKLISEVQSVVGRQSLQGFLCWPKNICL